MLQCCVFDPAVVRLLLYVSEVGWARGPIFTGVAGSRGVAGPMIHCLLTSTLLILAPEAVEGRFLASILAVMAVETCGRPSRYGQPTWDEPPLLGDAQDCLGMTVVAVDRPERRTHWSKWLQLHPFGQSNISLINLVHPSCAREEGLDWDWGRGTG
jgi:hypothetical protein